MRFIVISQRDDLLCLMQHSWWQQELSVTVFGTEAQFSYSISSETSWDKLILYDVSGFCFRVLLL